MMMRKIVILLLITFTYIKCCAQKVEYDGIKYEIKKGGYAYVLKINRDLEVVNIPEAVYYDGTKYPVREIGAGATWGATKFAKSAKVKKLSIPNTVVKIWEYAFQGCKHLIEIVLPNTPVSHIGNRAFENCKAISKVRCQDGSVASYISVHLEPNCPYMVSLRNESFPVHEESAQNKTEKVEKTSSESRKITAVSDVDKDIPSVSTVSENTFAVIFANESYQEEEDVEYAVNDGEVFKKYCHQILGLPQENVHIRKNATLNNMKAELAWVRQVAHAYKGDAKLIFFYAGHGVPSEKTGESYLLPVDGKGTLLDTGYKLTELYRQLGEMPFKNVTVFMDACFSGAKRGDGMLASARGVAIKAKTQTPNGKMIVFSAAQGDETAYPLKDKQHGLFTYYLLKKLKETKGECTLGQLSSFVTDQVGRKSIVANGKSQTPTITAAPAFGDNWKSLKLK